MGLVKRIGETKMRSGVKGIGETELGRVEINGEK